MAHLIVIGGTKGIGRAFRNLVAGRFDHITLVSRSRPADIETWTKSMKFVSADVTDPPALQKALNHAVDESGPVNGLVMFQRHRGKEDSWEGNIAATLTATRTAITCLQEKFAVEGDKSIVLISSIASRFVADEQDEGYHVAKTGLLGLVRYYAYRLGPLGIRVNAVSPGTLLKEESKDFFLQNKALHDLYREVTPLRRMGTAAEVSQVVHFLISDQASFITGQEIVVDGGAGLCWQESLARRLKQI